jgi:phage tail-like protein
MPPVCWRGPVNGVALPVRAVLGAPCAVLVSPAPDRPDGQGERQIDRRRGGFVMPASTDQKHNVVSAPRFAISVDGTQIKNLQVTEVKEIWSQLAAHEYIYSGGAHGNDLVYTKQFGQPKNTEVKITVAFSPDTFPAIWQWHKLAKSGSDQARTNAELTIYKSDQQVAAIYTMEDAWLAKVDVNIPKAGATDTASVALTIVCDDFFVPA